MEFDTLRRLEEMKHRNPQNVSEHLVSRPLILHHHVARDVGFRGVAQSKYLFTLRNLLLDQHAFPILRAMSEQVGSFRFDAQRGPVGNIVDAPGDWRTIQSLYPRQR